MPAAGLPVGGVGGSMPAVGMPFGGFGGSMPAVGMPFTGFGGSMPAVGMPFTGFGGSMPAVGMPFTGALGFQGYPPYGMPPGGGMVVWIPAIVGGPAGPMGTPLAAPPGGTGAPQPVMCMVEATNAAVLAEANAPAGQKVAVIADTEMACRAINGTVANPAAAGAGGPS
jgi:hypothetical protein